MNRQWFTEPNKRPFLYIIAVIAAVTVVLSASAGRPAMDILGYLGFVVGITYIVFA